MAHSLRAECEHTLLRTPRHKYKHSVQHAVTQVHKAALAPISAYGKAATIPVWRVSGEEGGLQ